jgi:hypothetical protein
MAFENPVKHGDFGTEPDRSSRKVSYDKVGTPGDAKRGGGEEHTETAKPVKGDTFSKR